MRRSRFSDEQIIGVLREHEASVKALALTPADAGRRLSLRLNAKPGDRQGGRSVSGCSWMKDGGRVTTFEVIRFVTSQS
jgi:hypothetical protein